LAELWDDNMRMRAVEKSTIERAVERATTSVYATSVYC
jgi:hypothetical protein